MTLYIKETSWGIDRMNGGRKERVTAKESFPCEVGMLPEFEKGRRQFQIDEVGEDYIVLAIHYEKSPASDKSWRIEVGDTIGYMPFSFDGGYKYEFKLKK